MITLQTDSAKYMIYMDENKYWLKIIQISKNNHIYVEVEEIYNLLMYGGDLLLDEEKNNIQKLTFDPSIYHLYGGSNYIDTYLTNKKGYRKRLINMLLAVMNKTPCSYRGGIIC